LVAGFWGAAFVLAWAVFVFPGAGGTATVGLVFAGCVPTGGFAFWFVVWGELQAI
jgi:hypothetical protein